MIIFIKNAIHFQRILHNNTESNIIDLTFSGIDVIFGRNKQHIKKGTMIKNATMGDIRRCKKRGISENFFGIIERYPCYH